jgi:hypothetical protein
LNIGSKLIAVLGPAMSEQPATTRLRANPNHQAAHRSGLPAAQKVAAGESGTYGRNLEIVAELVRQGSGMFSGLTKAILYGFQV